MVLALIVFVLNNLRFSNYNGKTLAELTTSEKNIVSARKMAALVMQKELLNKNLLKKEED